MELPEKLQSLVDALARIPGVGAKTAVRQALILARWDQADLREFSAAINGLSELVECRQCGLYCDEEICHICENHQRQESGIICVVESITDCVAIERSENFRGTYHILGGVLNPLMGVGPEDLGINRLIDRCQQGVQSIILAINSSVEGDATSSFIRQQLPAHVSVERIGFGIPMGGSLEYLDALTITKALENRKLME